jgi:hypothetical protein
LPERLVALATESVYLNERRVELPKGKEHGCGLEGVRVSVIHLA